MYGRVAVLLVALGPLPACGFDAKGAGDGGGIVLTSGTDTAASAGSSTGSAEGTEGGGSTGTSGTSTGASSSGGSVDSTTGSTTTAGASSTNGSTTGAVPTTGGFGTGGATECGNGPGLLLWVADAGEVESPMEVYDSQVLPPCGDQDPIRYAASPKKDQGTITWYFQADAPVDIRIFGLVFDDIPGIGGGADPDSYHLSLDGVPEAVWVYGCETDAWPQAQWGWVPVRPLVGNVCSDLDITFFLNPGLHSIRLRNREAEAGGKIASVAALYLAPEPNPDPYAAYDPGG